MVMKPLDSNRCYTGYIFICMDTQLNSSCMSYFAATWCAHLGHTSFHRVLVPCFLFWLGFGHACLQASMKGEQATKPAKQQASKAANQQASQRKQQRQANSKGSRGPDQWLKAAHNFQTAARALSRSRTEHVAAYCHCKTFHLQE